MSIEVFNRYEKKYMIDEEMAKVIMEEVSQYMEPDKYNKDNKPYSICNIYYDTPDSAIIRKSIQKPVYKEKLRLRGYNVPKPEDMVFLEIKKKFNGIVNKRRSSLSLLEAKEMIRTGKMPPLKPYMNEQILREIEYILEMNDIVPAVYLAYDRYAFFDRDNRDFRLTFDMNIRSRRDNLDLSLGNYGKQLFPDGRYIMEMKATMAVPLWFAKILSKYKLYPVSVSKYGTEYVNRLKVAQCK